MESGREHEAELVDLQGLYSGFVVEEPSSIFSKLPLQTAAPIFIVTWALFYLLLSLQLLPALHSSIIALSVAASVVAFICSIRLIRPATELGAWPANRTAALILLVTILDFWIWVFSAPYLGAPAHVYLFLDIAGFGALLGGVYLFVFKKLHIENLVKILIAKGFIDFGAYVLSGGFGFPLLDGLGFQHPLNLDTLFTIAMLELWVLLFYILKYRPKIMTLQFK